MRRIRYSVLSLAIAALAFAGAFTSCSADDQPQTTIHTTRQLEAPKKDSVKKGKREKKPKIQSFRTDGTLSV